MLVWSLVLSLATLLQVAQAYPKPDRPQYGSLGKHGGVATEVKTYNPQLLSPRNLNRYFLNAARQFHVDRWRNAPRSESVCLPKAEARSML